MRVGLRLSDQEERDLWARWLHDAGFLVGEEPLDLLVADLDVVVAEGWLLPDRHPPAERLLVVSEFGELLSNPVRAATLRKPVSEARFVEAVMRAYEGEPVRASGSGRLDDPTRVGAAAALARIVAVPDADLELLVGTIARDLNAEVGLLTLVDGERQSFGACTSVGADFDASPSSPRSWSLCQHVVDADRPLRVEDARVHPFLSDSPMVRAGVVTSYLGTPVRVEGVGAVGALCIVSDQPRKFEPVDLARLEMAANLAGAVLTRRRKEAAVAPPPKPQVGLVVDGKYLLTALLGETDHAQVFLGRDARTRQIVVIKVVAERSVDRESGPIAQIRHPNLVELHGWGKLPDGRAYLVIEHVDGESLADVLAAARARREGLPDEEVVSILRDVAGALTALLAAGVVHGDIKPGNVMLDRRYGRAVVIDLGLGQRVGAHSNGGTPGYSAPEQFTSALVDGRADVYALAALAWALLAGNGPFAPLPKRARGDAQLAGTIPPMSLQRKGVPDPVEALLRRALSPDPARRPATVVGLVGELERALASGTGSSRLDPDEPRTRGLLFRLARDVVRRTRGEAAEAEIFRRLDASHRAVFVNADDDLYWPTASFAAWLQLAGGAYDLGRVVAAGRARDQLRQLRVPRDPTAVLQVIEPLVQRDHDGLSVERRRVGADAVELIVGGAHAEALTPWVAGMAEVLSSLCGVPSLVTVDGTTLRVDRRGIE